MVRYLTVLAVLITAALGLEVVENSRTDPYTLTIRLEDAVSTQPDELVCTSVKLDPEESYIVKITPHAVKETAHHLMVYGCGDIPNKSDPYWQCNSDADVSLDSPNSVCRGGERQILFAWAMDAPPKSLPEDVGIRVSGDTGIKYLVVQLHYAFKFPDGLTDNSGATLTMSKERPTMQAGYLVLGNVGYIPPQKIAHHMDSYCVYDHDYPIYPIGFRTHAHELGYVTSGYRIRDGKWTEIGRMSPQLPETFYDVSNPGIDIRKGDKLVSRCTMNSMARKDVTMIGTTHHDEMCNFYIMYATYHQETLETDYCFQESPKYSWEKNFSPEEIPKDASSLKGIRHAEKVLEHFNMEKLL